MSTPAQRLAHLVAEHQPCVVLTGAGASTESGIPDFRSREGLWAEFDPLRYASLDAFRRDPEEVWRFYGPRFRALAAAEPNAAHFALAALERNGCVRAVVTQNIDLLHTRAGSREVVEVHGSIAASECLRCAARVPLADVLAQLGTDATAPRCPTCTAVLKPGVVFFGELLPEAAIERATTLARSARLVLVVGSSLEVHPVAALPLESLARGGRLAIVNRGRTTLDEHADLRIDASAGETLAAVARELAAA